MSVPRLEKQLAAKTEENERKAALVAKLELMLKEGEDLNDALKIENESLDTQAKSLLRALEDNKNKVTEAAPQSAEVAPAGGLQAQVEQRGYVKSLEGQIETLKRDQAKLEKAMIDMSDAHSQEIVAYMQSAQAAATKKGGWF